MAGLEVLTKTDVMYDGRRGAAVDVLSFYQVPFAIASRAGRELDDVQSFYIIDKEYFTKAMTACFPVADNLVEVTSKSQVIELNFWEGTPVKLGEQGMKRID